MSKSSKSFLLLAVAAVVAWLIWGRKAQVTSRITGFDFEPTHFPVPERHCLYWTQEGDTWRGLQGETVPLVRDMFGTALASPPDPPWSPCFA